MLSSFPISPFMEGNGSGLDDEGGGSLILCSPGRSSFRFEIPKVVLEDRVVWLDWTPLDPRLGVSLWSESGVSAPSPCSIKLDSEEERSRIFLWRNQIMHITHSVLRSKNAFYLQVMQAEIP